MLDVSAVPTNSRMFLKVHVSVVEMAQVCPLSGCRNPF